MPGISQPTTFPLSLTRFQRNYNWDVLLPDIGISAGGLVGFGIGQLAQSCVFGDYSIDTPSTMRVGPYVSNFVGLLNVPTVRIEFLKTFPDAISAYFNGWKKLMVDKQGLFQPKSNYQKNMYVRFVDSSGIAMGQYKLIGAFPITFPAYNLEYTSSKVTVVQITFAIDKIEYNWFA